MLKVFYLRISDCENYSDQFLWEKVGEETQKIVRIIQNERVRRMKCIGDIMIRTLIERYFMLRSEQYSIRRNEHGKPYVQAANAIYYNLSHSGDYIVCAISNQEVGIDIQLMGKEKPHLAERFFHPNEIKRLNDCCPNERTTLFYRYWAAKESFLKYIGTGLSGSLSSFEIFFEKKSVYLADSHLKKRVYIRECQIDKNYPCIVCAETSELPDLLPFYFPE